MEFTADGKYIEKDDKGAIMTTGTYVLSGDDTVEVSDSNGTMTFRYQLSEPNLKLMLTDLGGGRVIPDSDIGKPEFTFNLTRSKK
jgi:hypothetical protein